MNKFQPSNWKYRKVQKNKKKLVGIEFNYFIPQFGLYGIRCLENGLLNPSQIEACRRVISKKIQKNNMLWICCFPNVPVTSKPLAVRMGKGKGNFSFWAFPARTGRILFEYNAISRYVAYQAFKDAGIRIPFKTGFVERLL